GRSRRQTNGERHDGALRETHDERAGSAYAEPAQSIGDETIEDVATGDDRVLAALPEVVPGPARIARRERYRPWPLGQDPAIAFANLRSEPGEVGRVRPAAVDREDDRQARDIFVGIDLHVPQTGRLAPVPFHKLFTRSRLLPNQGYGRQGSKIELTLRCRPGRPS